MDQRKGNDEVVGGTNGGKPKSNSFRDVALIITNPTRGPLGPNAGHLPDKEGMERGLILGLTLLLYAAAQQPKELMIEILDDEEVEPTDQTNLFEANQMTKIGFDQELCSTTLQHDGINIFCPRTSNPFCFCEDNRCDCCFNIKLYLLQVDNNLCVELSYNAADKSMRLSVKWNKLPLISTGFPFLRPTEEPVCVGLSIIGSNVCIHFSDMSIIAGRPNFCASLVVTIFGKTVFTFKIGCFEYVTELGSDLRTLGFLLPADSYTRNITFVGNNPSSRLHESKQSA